MAKSNLEEKLNYVLTSIGEIQEKIEQQELKAVIQQPKVSVFRKHFDAIVENAFQSPHSTLSGIAVAGCWLGAKMFPQYAVPLSELQVFATGMTGVTAGNAVLSKTATSTAIKPVASANSDLQEYG